VGTWIHYAYPELIWVSALAFAAAVLAAIALERKRRALRRLARLPAVAPLVSAHRPRQVLKALLVETAAVLIGVALVGPQWGRSDRNDQTQAARGRDVLILLDVSRSMLAEDVLPNRLARAKADLRDWATTLERRGGYRIGLIAFADRAALLCPLTSDYRYFEEELKALSLATLRRSGDANASVEGTQIGAALLKAEHALDKDSAAYTDVLLVSDGGDMDAETLAAAERLAGLGVPVHAVGVGDPREGALIPVREPNGLRTFLQYRGEPVRTRLEEEVLQRIAGRTGGTYHAAGTGSLELERVYRAIEAAKPTRELPAEGTSRLYIHRYQWLLAPAVLFLLLEMFLGEARRRRVPYVFAQVKYFRFVRRQRRVEKQAA
jgi:Ca-activated chloride channel family protein